MKKTSVSLIAWRRLTVWGERALRFLSAVTASEWTIVRYDSDPISNWRIESTRSLLGASGGKELSCWRKEGFPVLQKSQLTGALTMWVAFVQPDSRHLYRFYMSFRIIVLSVWKHPCLNSRCCLSGESGHKDMQRGQAHLLNVLQYKAHDLHSLAIDHAGR